LSVGTRIVLQGVAGVEEFRISAAPCMVSPDSGTAGAGSGQDAPTDERRFRRNPLSLRAVRGGGAAGTIPAQEPAEPIAIMMMATVEALS